MPSALALAASQPPLGLLSCPLSDLATYEVTFRGQALLEDCSAFPLSSSLGDFDDTRDV